MAFSSGRFDFDALTSQNLFQNVHRIINKKIHFHHFYLTSKILSYAHDFCNMTVKENQNQFFCITNFFGFDMFFLLKGIRLSVWGIKYLNICGSGLTNINFASLGSQVKFINTMKYYVSSLESLASTFDVVDKMCIEKLILQFLNQHYYFSQIWPLLDVNPKMKV